MHVELVVLNIIDNEWIIFVYSPDIYLCPTYKIDLISEVPLFRLYQKLNQSNIFNFICCPLQILILIIKT